MTLQISQAIIDFCLHALLFCGQIGFSTEGSNMDNLQNRYQIYIECAKALGLPIKTFDEWLNS
jgi:hypothetical protein